MFVISISATKKKIKLAIKALVVVCLLVMLSYLFNSTLAASADAPVVITNGENSDEEEKHYPGEPIRVYNDLESYWEDKLTGLPE